MIIMIIETVAGLCSGGYVLSIVGWIVGYVCTIPTAWLHLSHLRE